MNIYTEHCGMVRDPDTVLRSSMGWDITMVSGGRVGYSQQTIPLHPCVSSSISPHNSQIILLLFLSYLPYLSYTHITLPTLVRV